MFDGGALVFEVCQISTEAVVCYITRYFFYDIHRMMAHIRTEGRKN